MFLLLMILLTNKLESSIHQLVYQMQDNSLSEDGNHDELNSRVEKVINSKIKSQDEHNLDKEKKMSSFYIHETKCNDLIL